MATIELRNSAKTATFALSIASSSVDGAPTASAVVATQGNQLNFPMHTKNVNSDKKMSSAEATQQAKEYLAHPVPAPEGGVPAPASDGGSGDGAPPAKAGRLIGPEDLMDLSGTPQTVVDSQDHPGTPPTATVPTADQIASMVASSMQKARQENQSKVEADNKKLLQTMSENNRRETEVAITTCV